MQFFHAGIYRNDVLHRSLFIDATDLSIESVERDRDGHISGIVAAANKTPRAMDPREALPIVLEQYPCSLIWALLHDLDLVGMTDHFESLRVEEALNRPDDSLVDQKVGERFGLVVWCLRGNL